MPKHLFKKLAPHPDIIKGNKHLGWIGHSLHLPSLWHFNRHNIALAFAIGLFWMWVPCPPQTVFAAATAVMLRANLPLSVALVFITNPITIPPLYYFAYEFGATILNQQIEEVKFELTFDWFQASVSSIWWPMLLGCLLLGVISAIIGYFSIHLFWRMHIIQRMKARRERKFEEHRKRVHPVDPHHPEKDDDTGQ